MKIWENGVTIGSIQSFLLNGGKIWNSEWKKMQTLENEGGERELKEVSPTRIKSRRWNVRRMSTNVVHEEGIEKFACQWVPIPFLNGLFHGLCTLHQSILYITPVHSYSSSNVFHHLVAFDVLAINYSIETATLLEICVFSPDSTGKCHFISSLFSHFQYKIWNQWKKYSRRPLSSQVIWYSSQCLQFFNEKRVLWSTFSHYFVSSTLYFPCKNGD